MRAAYLEITRKFLEDGTIGKGEMSYPKPEWFKIQGHWRHISEFEGALEQREK